MAARFITFSKTALAVVLGAVALSFTGCPARAQTGLDPFQAPAAGNQLNTPGMSPGQAFLFDLDTKFSAATLAGGGKAFASWFAPDGVTLSNGKAPVQGRDAIAQVATWLPASYKLSWIPAGGMLSGDMGYTWGRYTGVTTTPDGAKTTTTGRYITIWRKQPNGEWKVAMDASNDEPAAAGECCKVP